MSDIRARYIGHPDGTHLPAIPVTTENEPPRSLGIPYGGELPTEIDGHKVDPAFRDSLLAQQDNWTKVRRATGTSTKSTTAAKADEKEA